VSDARHTGARHQLQSRVASWSIQVIIDGWIHPKFDSIISGRRITIRVELARTRHQIGNVSESGRTGIQGSVSYRITITGAHLEHPRAT